jgi:peroxiredoxin-like protein
MSTDSHDYPVTVRWIGHKEGVAESADGLEPLPVSSPPQFGGPAGVWTPEHMVVAATAACLMTTFLAVAEASRLTVLSLEVPGHGTLTRGDDRRYSISRIVLRPRLTIATTADRERALRLLDKAHAACLVSRSLKSEVVVEAQVEVAHPALVDA